MNELAELLDLVEGTVRTVSISESADCVVEDALQVLRSLSVLVMNSPCTIDEGTIPGVNEGTTPGVDEGLTPGVNEGTTPVVDEGLPKLR